MNFVKPDIILTGQAERYLASQKGDAERECMLLNFTVRDMCDRTKIQRGFHRALLAIFSKRSSEEYLNWTNDVDAYTLMKLAQKCRGTEPVAASAFLERASTLVPGNRQIRNEMLKLQGALQV